MHYIQRTGILLCAFCFCTLLFSQEEKELFILHTNDMCVELLL